jgi:hypothetical protein
MYFQHVILEMKSVRITNIEEILKSKDYFLQLNANTFKNLHEMGSYQEKLIFKNDQKCYETNFSIC